MPNQYPSSPIIRFWAAVDKNGPVHPSCGQCWIWTKATADGYGTLNVNGEATKSHRFSWKIHFGAIPFGLYVLHRCDNPACVNPTHLFLGTGQDNQKDMYAKGRGRKAKGESNGNANLSQEQVDEIRRRYRFRGKDGNNAISLAREFGVCRRTILMIVHLKTWTET